MSAFDARPDATAVANRPSKSPPARSNGRHKAAAAAQQGVRIEATIERLQRGFIPPRIQASRLSTRQAAVLKALTDSLRSQHATMANGRHVEAAPDALRWLLDQIAEQLPAELLASE